MNLADYLTDAPWKQRAACRTLDPSIFFPGQGTNTSRPAKAICQDCPMQSECLAEALSRADHYDYGVWGGTTPRERRKLRKRQAA